MTVKTASLAYRDAVVAEAHARVAHRENRSRKPDTYIALVTAIGRTAEARAALDEEILTAHGLTKPKT